jgi:hypothetical protein
MGRSQKPRKDHDGNSLKITANCRAAFWPYGVPGEDRWGGGGAPKETRPRLDRYAKSYSLSGRTPDDVRDSWIGD